MENYNEKLSQLQEKLNILELKHYDFSKEMYTLKAEIHSLKKKIEPSKTLIQDTKPKPLEQLQPTPKSVVKNHSSPKDQINIAEPERTSKTRSEWEKFIGENLINKIGIVITVIGIAIGAKYSIDHDLISPLARIILGYVAGIALLLVGFKLKEKYESYSAVLVSGAMASMYFITFAAYNYYHLFGNVIAFGLMVIFTIFTVIAALNYNRQVIAIIGLVGAYSVPILLSDGNGRIGIMLTYMCILNIGILAVSIKKEWRPLLAIAFCISWIVYLLWFLMSYSKEEHLTLALTFLTLFFITFYLAVLIYKIINNTKFALFDIVLIMTNSLIFYGVGYSIFDSTIGLTDYIGLFTLVNAAIHIGVGSIIYKRNLADKNVFYLILGLAITFITIAIPVQLDGHWVTLLWALEAAVLYWVGRMKDSPIYEKISYPLMGIAVLSLFQDWSLSYGANINLESLPSFTTLFNIHFLSTLIVLGCAGFIYYISNKASSKAIFDITGIIGGIGAIILFFGLGLEISHFWNVQYVESWIASKSIEYSIEYKNYNILSFQKIWMINYGLLFLGIISWLNNRYVKHASAGNVLLALTALATLLFMSIGLYEISELREAYLLPEAKKAYSTGVYYIFIRYISLGILAATIISTRQFIDKKWLNLNFKIPFELIVHGLILWVLSSELLHWLNFANSTNQYKLVLSILWGLYSLFLVSIGIWKNKQHLRIAAISLFALTLIKLFIYDINHLDTIAKTAIFIILGVFLLIISFLYNKYKTQINDEN